MRLADELKDSIMVALGTLVAAVLVVPLAVAQLVLLPFASTDTPEDVAALIRKCIDRAEDADDELDAFTSRKIRDPRLDRIKTELTALAGADWEAPETRARLRKLLRRVEAMG